MCSSDLFDAPPVAGDSAPAEKSISLGSGFVIDPAGLIVTNNHVIAGADKITVTLQNNVSLPATLVGRDVQTDLALLRVRPTKPLPAVSFGDSDAVRVGDWAIAIGNPYGFGGTITAGIISAKGRAINDGGPYDDFLQTDAAINKGNSGGPLFNLSGQVVGINSAIFSPSGGSAGIGFAIPSVLVSHVVGELKRYHHVRRGWIGARVQSINPDIAAALDLPSTDGTLLGAVVPSSPAARAGMKPGDVILAVDGRTARDLRQFRRLIDDLAPGTRATIQILRDGSARLVPVTLGNAALNEPPPVSDDSDSAAAPVAPQPSLTTLLGLSLAAPTDALRDQFQIGDTTGIVVVAAGKSAGTPGTSLSPGDVIVEADGMELRRPRDLTAQIAQLRKLGRKQVLLLVDRGGDLRYVTVPLNRG